MTFKDKIAYALPFLKTLTIKKIVNSILLRISYQLSIFTKKQIHWGKPESLSVEPTNLCNLKCPECPSGTNTLNRSRLYLSFEAFHPIIDQLKDYLEVLQLYFQGEPFMNPKVYDFIRYATSKNIYTTTSTNGHFLTLKNCEKIIGSGLHQLIISVDGTTQQVYQTYRVGGSLDKVIEGIQNLQKEKNRLNSKTPHIVLQFVVLKNNEHQIGDIKRLARQLKISDLRLKSAQIYDFNHRNEIMTTIDMYSRYYRLKNGLYALKRKSNFKCYRVWSGMVITANQDILPCCFDKKAEFAYNSDLIQNLQNIFTTTKVKDFQHQVWQANHQIEICRNCTEGLRKTWFR